MAMATEVIARNFRRSLRMPITPNTAAAKNAGYITSSTRAPIGLPHPGWSKSIIPAVRTDTTRQAIAAFPKQYALARSQMFRTERVIFKNLLGDCLCLQMARVTHAAGYSYTVEVIKQGDGEFSGRLEKVFELDAFEAAFLLDKCRQ